MLFKWKNFRYDEKKYLSTGEFTRQSVQLSDTFKSYLKLEVTNYTIIHYHYTSLNIIYYCC